MAMVVSHKSKLCMCSLVLIVLIGIGLAVVSSFGVLDRKEHLQLGTAEKLSQKPSPRIIDRNTSDPSQITIIPNKRPNLVIYRPNQNLIKSEVFQAKR
ncbi:unnamed protein product [Euphydryas editha]|uniref:Uncharacterized protein n=1 Tax=Euphydryas editha TaxID=104508 RepID=A0AAU9TXE1_EUPED|nr:unnamed protein product [Euphydryas editha]